MIDISPPESKECTIEEREIAQKLYLDALDDKIRVKKAWENSQRALIAATITLDELRDRLNIVNAHGGVDIQSDGSLNIQIAGDDLSVVDMRTYPRLEQCYWMP